MECVIDAPLLVDRDGHLGVEALVLAGTACHTQADMHSLARLPFPPNLFTAPLAGIEICPRYDEHGYRKRGPSNLAWVSVISKCAYPQDTDYANNSRSYSRPHKDLTSKFNLEDASITTPIPLDGSDKGVVLIKQSQNGRHVITQCVKLYFYTCWGTACPSRQPRTQQGLRNPRLENVPCSILPVHRDRY